MFYILLPQIIIVKHLNGHLKGIFIVRYMMT